MNDCKPLWTWMGFVRVLAAALTTSVVVALEPAWVYGYLGVFASAAAHPFVVAVFAMSALMRLLSSILLERPVSDLWFLPVELIVVLAFAARGRLVSASPDGDCIGRFVHAHSAPMRRVLVWIIGLLVATLIFRNASVVHAFAWAVILGVLAAGMPKPDPARRPVETVPRRIGATAALCVFATLFSAGILEGGARLLFDPPAYRDAPLPEETTGRYASRRSRFGVHRILQEEGDDLEIVVEYSSQGLRDREYGPKRPGEVRILLLGDSFTEGSGVPWEATIGQVLERRLNAGLSEPHYTVINAGFLRYCPYQERQVLIELGFGLEPDIVILQVLLANDVEDSIGRYKTRFFAPESAWRDGAPEISYRNLPPVRAQRWLFDHSRAYSRFCDISGNKNWPLRLWNGIRLLPPCPFPKIDISEGRPSWIEADHLVWTHDFGLAWEMFQRDVCDIRDDCAERGVDFLAYAVPTLPAISRAKRDECVKRYRLDEREYDWSRETVVAERFFGSEGIECIDLLAPFRTYPDPDSLFYWDDGHFTEDGARLAAETIEQCLRCRFASSGMSDGPGRGLFGTP